MMCRGFAGVVVVVVCALLLLGALWFVSRDAPSAGRDPNLTPFVLLPTRTPTPVEMEVATPGA